MPVNAKSAKPAQGELKRAGAEVIEGAPEPEELAAEIYPAMTDRALLTC
jgi:hypothetical protein